MSQGHRLPFACRAAIVGFLAVATAIPPTVATASGDRMPELPFDIPSRSTLAASSRQVLAYWHMLPTYWRNNRDAYADWLSPTGAGGKFYAFGGKWRARPIPVNNSNLTNQRRVAEMYKDISDAAAIGIDAFLFNVPYGPSDFRWNEQLLPIYEAADQFTAQESPAFSVGISLTAFQIARKRSTSEGSPSTWADRIAPFLKRPSYYKYKDKPVVAVYHVSRLNAAWYRNFAARLKNRYGEEIYIFPSYQGNKPAELNQYADLVPDLMPFLHVWSNVAYTTSPSGLFSRFRGWAAENGVKFMGSVKHNVHRASTLKTIESQGFGLLQNMWMSSIENDDEIVQIVSWNDHTENHDIRPSTGYQYVPYDISAYYITWFKSGSPPPIVRDVVYYAHRMHRTNARRNTSKQPKPFTFQLSWKAPPVDEVTILSFLKAPANVRIMSGGQNYTMTNVPAGVSMRSAPLYGNDRPTFSVSRGVTEVVPEFSSAFQTRGAVVWQDLQYRMGSSSRAAVPAVQNNLPEDR